MHCSSSCGEQATGRHAAVWAGVMGEEGLPSARQAAQVQRACPRPCGSCSLRADILHCALRCTAGGPDVQPHKLTPVFVSQTSF